MRTVVLMVTFVLVFIDVGRILQIEHYPDVAEIAEAATGDFAIFRESTGTEIIPTSGATVDLTWDTTVESNSNITLQGNNSDIDLADGGKYLVTYNSRIEQGTTTTGTNRRSLLSWLTLDGVELPYGRASNYMRDSDGTLMTYLSGGAIIDAAAGADLELHMAREDVNPTNPNSARTADTDAINVLKLKDSWDYLRVFNSATTSDVQGDTSFTPIQWGNADEVDTGSFGFTATSADITLVGNDQDLFLVTANVTLYVDGTASTRQNYEMQLTLDGTAIPGTLVTAYPRGNQNSEEIHYATLSYMGIIAKESASDEDLNLEMRRESSGSQTTDMVPYQSAMSIVALPDTGSYIRLGDAGGSQTLTNSAQDMTWDTQYEVDSAAFSHSTTTGSDVINIDADGDYLFFATVRSTTTNGANNRQPFTVDWKEDGAALTRGSFWGYNRNNGVNSAGGSGAVIFPNLTTSSFIELQYFDESSNAPANSTLAANGISIQGIYLDENFFGTDVFVTATGTQTASLNSPITDQYIGGTFVLTEQTGSRNVTSITITENGTVDGSTDLSNIELWYEMSTTSPYDCSEKSYDGDETQYGGTDANGFSGANGVSAFSGSVNITTTDTMCVYVVLDSNGTESDGETIDISIDDPVNDIDVSDGGSVGPPSTVSLSGVSTLQRSDLTQSHYHWRTDDGTETSVTGGAEDTAAGGFQAGVNRRLRLEVAVEGFDSIATNAGILDAFSTGTTKNISDGTNRMLLVGIHSEDTAGSFVDVNNVTYGGQTLTEVHDEQVTTTGSNGMWVGYLDEAGIQAATGNTITPTWVGGTPSDILYSSVVLQNVNQSNPVTGFSGGSGTTVSSVQPTTTVATTEGDRVVYFTVSSQNGSSHTEDTGYTEGTDESSGSQAAANASIVSTGSSTEQPTATWSITATRLAIVALNVNYDDSNLVTPQFRLQYGEKSTTCEAITTWVDVAENGGAWDAYDSSNVANEGNTTDIAAGIGGVTNEEANFIGTNAIVDGGDKSVSIELRNDDFVELEYTVVPTSSATEGSTYCFRVVDEILEATHSYRIPLTVQSSQVPTTQTDFPVYVDLSTLGSHFHTNVVHSDGGDIRVTAADGVTELPREIVSLATSTEEGEMHFEAPSLSASSDTTFYIYYGASTEQQYQASSTYGTHQVWDNGYLAVYHMPTTTDSTGNNFTLTASNVSSVSTAQVGTEAADFNGSTSVYTNTLLDTALNGLSAIAFSAWIQSDLTSTDKGFMIVPTIDGSDQDFNIRYDIAGATGGGTDVIKGSIDTSAGASQYETVSSVQTTSWQHVAHTWQSGQAIELSLDGAQSYFTATPTSQVGTTAVGSGTLYLGASSKDATSGGWDGRMDEVRFSDAYRSPEWFETAYNNQSSVSSFYSTTTFESNNATAVPVIYSVYPEANITADVQVSATGTQVTSVNENSTNNYIEGAFVIQDNTGARNVTSITMTETGTVDASSSLQNIRLYYDLDTSNPYDCASESYTGGEAQFGATSTAFSSANGTTTFTDTVGVSTTASLCLYPVVEVNTNAGNGETIDLEISLPNTEVIVSSGSVGPGTAAQITGSTSIQAALLTQTHYHWRNDDGDETDTGATSATGGVEDTALLDVPKESTRRLRMQVSNEGAITSPATQYRLEYGTKISSCALIAENTWQQVGVGVAFATSASAFIADGNTTDVDNTANGAMTEENTTLVGTGALREDSSESGSITLTNTEYTELEFSIEATTDSAYDADYCFRVTDQGEPLDSYSSYAELTTRERQDFFIQRGSATISGTSLTVNAGASYTAPSATTTAFVRITNMHMTGAGDDVGTNGQPPDDVTAYISDQSDITSSFTIARPSTASNNTRVDWEIIEYIGLPGADNEMIVRDVGEVAFAATEFIDSGNTVNDVADESDVVVFITGQRNNSNSNAQNNDGWFTAAWDQAASTTDFERDDADVTADVSYALVEFTGANWQIQRVEHNYTAAGTTETEPITAVTAVSQAFVHAQKRVGEGLQSIDEGGHHVWLSGLGQISYELQSTAQTPGDHYSVAWLIENMQTGDGAMAVYRSSVFLDQPGASEPLSTFTEIGSAEPVNVNNTSIYGTSYSAGTGTTYPRLHAALTIASSTHYEFWQSDTNNDHWYRASVVEWPVAEVAVRQNYYRFYVDNDAIQPTDPWPVGATNLGENTSITAVDDPVAEGEVLRIRMTGVVSNATLPELTKSYKLQYGKRDSTCSAISSWNDVGAAGGGEIWRGYDGTPADGSALSAALITSVTDVLGTYEEENNSAVNPSAVDIGEDIEFDWLVQHNGALQRTDYCFRMVESDGTLLAGYNNYPTARTTGYTPVTANWRWYDDATNTTPVWPLAAENAAPIDIINNNEIKLRIGVHEIENASANNVKFKLQYSESSDFSTGVYDVLSSTTCNLASSTTAHLWCYADGGGADGTLIDEAVLSDSDSCTGGSGVGCGHYNSGTTSPSTLTQTASSNMEFEFTIRQDGARANAVYYFRLYDLANDDVVLASSTYPSLQVEGPQLTFTLEGLPAGTTTEGVTADVTTTANTIPFGTVPFDTEYEAAYRLNVDTTATEGYQVFMFARQPLLNSYGDPIPDVNGTNAVPLSWSAGCLSSASACFGYHTGDDVLAGGSTRFSADDTYAAFSTTVPEEIMNATTPIDDTVDVIFKLEITEGQAAGDYETEIVYLAVPSF